MKTDSLKQEIRKRWEDPAWADQMARGVYRRTRKQRITAFSAKAAAFLVAGSFILWALWSRMDTSDTAAGSKESTALLETEDGSEILPAMDLVFDELPEVELALMPW